MILRHPVRQEKGDGDSALLPGWLRDSHQQDRSGATQFHSQGQGIPVGFLLRSFSLVPSLSPFSFSLNFLPPVGDSGELGVSGTEFNVDKLDVCNAPPARPVTPKLVSIHSRS